MVLTGKFFLQLLLDYQWTSTVPTDHLEGATLWFITRAGKRAPLMLPLLSTSIIRGRQRRGSKSLSLKRPEEFPVPIIITA